VYSAGVPSSGAFSASTGHRVCRDPRGDGWLHFVSSTGKVYRSAGNAGASSWVEIANMPTGMAGQPNMILAAIDVEAGDKYGVVWVITSYGIESNQNGHQAWLFKPPA
jgi:hypothetical protein